MHANDLTGKREASSSSAASDVCLSMGFRRDSMSCRAGQVICNLILCQEDAYFVLSFVKVLEALALPASCAQLGEIGVRLHAASKTERVEFDVLP